MSKTIRSTIMLVLEEVIQDTDDTHVEANATYDLILENLEGTHFSLLKDQCSLQTIIVIQE